jgi:hypothetical protein
MKKMYLSVMLCLFGFGAQAQGPDSTVVFDSTVHDFGEIQQGTSQSFVFEFTNRGSEPVLIQSVRPSCGCTTPSWTKEPVEPGKGGYVQATYNATATGPFNKSLTVMCSGSPESIVLHVKGTVKGTGD